MTVKDVDQFEIADETFLEEETIKEGTASLQDLLKVISSADLEDALPQAMVLLEIAVVTPWTNVHCETVFSRMKTVISSLRSCMFHKRKNNLYLCKLNTHC